MPYKIININIKIIQLSFLPSLQETDVGLAACANKLVILPSRDGYTHGDTVYTVGQCTISQDTTSLDPSRDRSVVTVPRLSH